MPLCQVKPSIVIPYSCFSFFLSIYVHAVIQNVKLASHQIVTDNVRDIIYRSGIVDS